MLRKIQVLLVPTGTQTELITFNVKNVLKDIIEVEQFPDNYYIFSRGMYYETDILYCEK